MSYRETMHATLKIVEKFAEAADKPGVVIEFGANKKKVLFDDLIRELKELKNCSCETCNLFDSAPNSKRGHCTLNYGHSVSPRSIGCQQWVPRSKERRNLDAKVKRLSAEKRT